MTESPFLTSLRDVGASINKIAGREFIVPGKLYVSASLETATDEDNELLCEDYNLKTMISTEQSLDIGANPARTGKSGNILSSKFMGVTQPVTDAMWVRGPIGESLEVLDTGVEQICDLFKALLCQIPMYPLLICGGKWMREQNLLIVLILLVLRVPVEHISADYVSCVQNMQTREGCFKTRGEADLVRAMVEKKAAWAGAIKNHLDVRYGGVETYLMRGGVTVEEIGSLREALQASGSRTLLDDKE
ncbi:hypothetical protein KCU61_g4953, partial [Aureobasidium melanogenum]